MGGWIVWEVKVEMQMKPLGNFEGGCVAGGYWRVEVWQGCVEQSVGIVWGGRGWVAVVFLVPEGLSLAMDLRVSLELELELDPELEGAL